MDHIQRQIAKIKFLNSHININALSHNLEILHILHHESRKLKGRQ